MKSTTYGKPSAELLQHKQSFFDENDKHLHKQQTIAELYRSQQARQKCKNCDHELSTQHDFIKDTIAYSLCKNCNHLNGHHEDSDYFCSVVYTQDDGAQYAENYNAENREAYFSRVKNIYLPKAEFLAKSLTIELEKLGKEGERERERENRAN